MSDPVLSLRILFNCLRDGGQRLVETMAVDGPAVAERARHADMLRAGLSKPSIR